MNVNHCNIFEASSIQNAHLRVLTGFLAGSLSPDGEVDTTLTWYCESGFRFGIEAIVVPVGYRLEKSLRGSAGVPTSTLNPSTLSSVGASQLTSMESGLDELALVRWGRCGRLVGP